MLSNTSWKMVAIFRLVHELKVSECHGIPNHQPYSQGINWPVTIASNGNSKGNHYDFAPKVMGIREIYMTYQKTSTQLAHHQKHV